MASAEAVAAATIANLAGSYEERLLAVRRVKHAVVGNPTNKRLYFRLGAVPPLLDAAQDSHSHPVLAEQSVAALGSLAAQFPPQLISQVTSALIGALFSPDPRPTKAAARALKMLLVAENMDAASVVPTLVTSPVAYRLVTLVAGADEAIAEVCAVILSRASLGAVHAKVFEQAGAIAELVNLMCRTNHDRCVEACLNAISSISRHDRQTTQKLSSRDLIPILLPFIRNSSHSLRLSACRLLTVFHSAGQLPAGVDGIVTNALVGLLDAGDVIFQTAAAQTFSELVSRCESLQKAAAEMGAVETLGDVIKSSKHVAEQSNDRSEYHYSHGQANQMFEGQLSSPFEKAALHAAALSALAAVCSDFDDAREKVVSAALLPFVIEALSCPYPEVVLGSMQCIRSLGRSVTVLRRDLAKRTIGRLILSLLSSKRQEICLMASTTLCNLSLEFSSVREVLVDEGGITKLAELLGSKDGDLRKNVLWVLKNVLFNADSDVKTCVMAALGYERLRTLCTDPDPRARVLSMTIVRNLSCSPSIETNNQLDALFGAIGDRLISLLSDALQTHSTNSELAEQALYVICNIACGTEEHKRRLMDSNIPQQILRWTAHENERARIAAVWCAINLSKKEKSGAPRTARFMRRSERPGARDTFDLRHDGHGGMAALYHFHRSPSTANGRVAERNSSRGFYSSNPPDAGSGVEPAEGRGAVADTRRDQSGTSRSSQDMVPVEFDIEGNQCQASERGMGFEWRIGRLRELGFEDRLRSLVNSDPDTEVQGRARAALEMFDCRDLNPLDYNPSALLDYDSSVRVRQSSQTLPMLLSVPESDSSSQG